MVKLTRGERFKQIREERGFKTQREVLDACGVQKSMLSALENDESCRDVGFSHIVKLSELYGVSLDWLFGRSEIRSVDADVQAACKFTGLGQEALQKISEEIKSEPLMAELLNYLFTDIVFLDCLDKLLDYYCFFKGDKLCTMEARENVKHLENTEEYPIVLTDEIKNVRWALCNNPELSWRIKDILYAQHLQEADAEERDFSKYEADLQQIIRYQTEQAFNVTLDRFEDS